MGGRVETFASLAATIGARDAPSTRLVAVDGPGGAGKSVFASRLARALGGAPVVHTDDFATGEPGVEWWPRLDREVIRPLVAGRSARYRRWDWELGALAEAHEVAAGGVVIVEGVSSARRSAAAHLVYAIWMHAPRALRLRRGLERDGRDAAPDWERWMAEEDAFFAADDPLARVDLVVDGASDLGRDAEERFAVLSAGRYV